MRLDSGEVAQITSIPRAGAIAFLQKQIRTRTALGMKFTTSRHRRGPGAAVDMINYGLVAGGKPRAVMRIGPAPFGNQPLVSAIGQDLAPHGAYLMRLAGVGISRADLTNFVRSCGYRFRADQRRNKGRDFRYLVSIDDPRGWLIESESVFEAPAYAGEVYVRAGALFAGYSKTRRQPTRYVNQAGQLCSVYRGGRNIINDLPPGTRLVESGPKQRFVFVLAPENSPAYRLWRAALPANVVEPQDAPYGWVQPRLLASLRPAAAIL